MRLLRNRGVLSAMPAEEKLALGKWLLNCTHGDLAIKMHHFGRADMHKLAKEAFLCLAESCTREELEQVRDVWSNTEHAFKSLSLPPKSGFCSDVQITQMWGGPGAIQRCLRGWLFLQGLSYERRLKAVHLHHASHPDLPAFSYTRYAQCKLETSVCHPSFPVYGLKHRVGHKSLPVEPVTGQLPQLFSSRCAGMAMCGTRGGPTSSRQSGGVSLHGTASPSLLAPTEFR